MTRPVHFEIHASDPAQVRAFYEGLFGWQFQQWADNPYWVVMTGDGNPMEGKPHSEPGIDGGMLPRMGGPPVEGAAVNAFVITVGVENCDATVEAALAAGGSVALPAQDMEWVGRVAYLKDPDGNIFGVIQGDPDADYA